MKRIHTTSLIAVLAIAFSCFSIQSGVAQEQQKVIIIKKEVDENGQVKVERIVRSGDGQDVTGRSEDVQFFATESDPAQLSTSGDLERTIRVNALETDGHGKQIVINVDGDVEVYKLEEGEALDPEVVARLAEKGVEIELDGDDSPTRITADRMIWVTKDDEHEDGDFRVGSLAHGLVAAGKGLAHLGDMPAPRAWAIRENINCAALGVYVSTNTDGGVLVSNTIGESGAEESGIRSGDVIKMIDEYPTVNYPQLHEALSLYEPGDVVTVTFLRGDQEQRLDVQLRAWKDFPSFANRIHASVRCGEEPEPEVISRKIIVIKKNRSEEADEEVPVITEAPINNALFLQDFIAFPNPSSGKFNVQFSGEELPTVVSIFDAAGREIFRDAVEEFDGFYQKEVDISGQGRGAFVLSVEQNGKYYTEQIILN